MHDEMNDDRLVRAPLRPDLRFHVPDKADLHVDPENIGHMLRQLHTLRQAEITAQEAHQSIPPAG